MPYEVRCRIKNPFHVVNLNSEDLPTPPEEGRGNRIIKYGVTVCSV